MTTAVIDGELVLLILALLFVAAGMAVNIAFGPEPGTEQTEETTNEGETP